jgi:hypothetical protein
MAGNTSRLSAFLFIGLGVVLLLFGGLGVNLYMQSGENPGRPLWENPAITMKKASMAIMPAGFLGGAGLIVWGALRLRNDDDGGDAGDETPEA